MLVRVHTKNKYIVQVTKYEGHTSKNTIYQALECGDCIADPKREGEKLPATKRHNDGGFRYRILSKGNSVIGLCEIQN